METIQRYLVYFAGAVKSPHGGVVLYEDHLVFMLRLKKALAAVVKERDRLQSALEEEARADIEIAAIVGKMEDDLVSSAEQNDKLYRAGFEDCRSQALNIVDEHDGYLNRIGLLEPTRSQPVNAVPARASTATANEPS